MDGIDKNSNPLIMLSTTIISPRLNPRLKPKYQAFKKMKAQQQWKRTSLKRTIKSDQFYTAMPLIP